MTDLIECEWAEPLYTGPSWQRNPDGTWHLPERTIGWEMLAWCSTWLRNPDGTPWIFTAEQVRLILWWYEIDENGRFVNSVGVIQRSKGWGKDPLLACIAIFEFLGNCRFSHWAEDGITPVCKRPQEPWVVIAAVSRDQTRNTVKLIPSLLSKEAISHYRVKIGAELIRSDDGRARLEAVTSAYRTLEGMRPSFSIANEVHHWVPSAQGDLMWDTIENNMTKIADSRAIAISNAFMPGEESVGEALREHYDKIAEGEAVKAGLWYDSVEGHPNTPLTREALELVLPKIYGDAHWLDVDDIINKIMRSTTNPARSRRFWLNQIVASDDALYSAGDWIPLGNPKLVLRANDEICIGFDGSLGEDSTALVAIRVKDQAIFLLGLWEKPDGEAGKDWQVPRDRVDAAVHEAFRLYDVKAMFCDVAYWEAYIDQWQQEYGHRLAVEAKHDQPMNYDMRRSLQQVTRDHEQFVRAILDRRVKHDGNKMLRRHVLNVIRRENKFGVSFGKASKTSPRKIDAYAAAFIAYTALRAFRDKGKNNKPRTGRSYWI